MNKHNSVTSTYYLLLKHKKKEYIKELEKSGKRFNKYYEVSNEKQELMDLLMNFESSTSKRKEKKKQKIEEIREEKEIIEKAKKEKEIPKNKNKPDIVSKSKSQEKKVKKKEDLTVEFKTIDYTENKKFKNEMKNPPIEFQTVDYGRSDNTRNNIIFTHDPDTEVSSKSKNKEITYIKNRRTGSTDCTNNKLNKREVKRISGFNKKNMAADFDTDEGEIIISNRRNNPEQSSPSPSPMKYNIEPNKNKVFDMNMLMKSSNYESVKNKK